MWWRIFVVIVFTSTICFGQKNDYVWILGGNSVNHFNNGYQWGTAIVDFKEDPVRFLYNEKITMDLKVTNSVVANHIGNLLMYSNGMYVHSGIHKDIPGLDTISYSSHWENFNYHDFLPDGSDWKSGLSGNQWILMLPDPGDKDAYFIFHPYVEITKGPSYLAHLLATKVMFNDRYPKGKMIFKDQIVRSGIFQWGLTAVRHGNGRDWWLVHDTKEYKTYDIYLVNANGIRLDHEELDNFRTTHRNSYMHASFSPRGDHYAIAGRLELSDTSQISIYSFDRCNGRLSKKENKLFVQTNILYGSIAFSADGKYLYYSDGLTMYQCDMDAEDILGSAVVVAEFDGSISEVYKEKLLFSSMALAPDGRIYCIPSGNTRSIHTIEYPEEPGVGSKMIQNKIKLPIKNFNSIPNVPYYRLGPEDGSPCDTLGIDNVAMAYFRYDQDTSDHRRLRFTDLSYFMPERWEWDFGDGTTFSGRKPYFHNFPTSGTYRVCLTVSNTNGSHEYCKDVVIGNTTFTVDDEPYIIQVHLFPNPTAGDIQITISDYVPADARILIYDAMGNRIVDKRVYYGQNPIDLSHVPSGIYFYRISEHGKDVKNGTLTKF
jgi:hypothetical protein